MHGLSRRRKLIFPAAATPPMWKHADEYSWVIYRGKKFELNTKQAQFVQFLDKRRRRGGRSVRHKAHVQEEVSGETDTGPRDYFANIVITGVMGFTHNNQ